MEPNVFEVVNDPASLVGFDERRRVGPRLILLNEDTATRYVAHVAECRQINEQSRTIGTEQGCEDLVQWCRARGAEIVECSMCTPRLELRRAFHKFRGQCIWLRQCFNTFTDLYHDEHEPKDLLANTAGHFFQTLVHVLREYGMLQAARITDPPRTRGKKSKETLTVCNLNGALMKHGLMTQEIEDAAAGLLRYRLFIVDARNRIIAHHDKDTAFAGLTLGAHPAHEVDAFLEHLQIYNDGVGRVVGEGPCDFRSMRGYGDVTTLLQHLRVGLHVLENDEERWYRIANGSVLERAAKNRAESTPSPSSGG